MVRTTRLFPSNGILGSLPQGQTGFLRIGECFCRCCGSPVLISCSKFTVDDAELEWTYASVCKNKELEHVPGVKTQLIINQNSFDFIHFRAVAQGITKWPQVLAEAYRCLKPGGYIELSEIDSNFVQVLD
jgi:SAM-dependent methyltransferase